jgi:hypothetical protein
MNSEEQEVMDQLVSNGDFQLHIDELGRRRYRPTAQFYNRYPDAGKMWDGMIGEAITSLWMKGFIEVEVLDEGFAIQPLPDPSKFGEIDTLDPFERDILTSIQIMIAEGVDE